jgi:hypothetical protein
MDSGLSGEAANPMKITIEFGEQQDAWLERRLWQLLLLPSLAQPSAEHPDSSAGAQR